MSAIDVRNLVKVYSDGTRAVDDISFTVGEGEFFGFLGPNGAGKTTTIKILSTLLRKTSGEAKVNGFDVNKDSQSVRKVIGVQGQELGIDEDLTGRENVELLGHLFGVPRDEIRKRAADLLQIVGLDSDADKRAAYYSGGMKKRLDLAASLIHRPKVLFLDEPTTGLDPQTRLAVWKYVKELNRREKVTVFLTTQYMEEADRLCDRIAIVDQGRIVASGTPSELKSEIGADVITVALSESEISENPSILEIARDRLKTIDGVQNIATFENGVSLFVRSGGSLIPAVVRALDEARVNVVSLSLSSPTLDDVFVKHTGRKIRPEELRKTPRRMMFGRRRR